MNSMYLDIIKSQCHWWTNQVLSRDFDSQLFIKIAFNTSKSCLDCTRIGALCRWCHWGRLLDPTWRNHELELLRKSCLSAGFTRARLWRCGTFWSAGSSPVSHPGDAGAVSPVTFGFSVWPVGWRHPVRRRSGKFSSPNICSRRIKKWLVGAESVFHAVSGSGNWHRTDLASGSNERWCVMFRYPIGCSHVKHDTGNPWISMDVVLKSYSDSCVLDIPPLSRRLLWCHACNLFWGVYISNWVCTTSFRAKLRGRPVCTFLWRRFFEVSLTQALQPALRGCQGWEKWKAHLFGPQQNGFVWK